MIRFQPLTALYEDPVPKEQLLEGVAKDFKETSLMGVPEAELEISFKADNESDILIKRIDPENALGYSTYSGEDDYFDHLSAELHEPTDEEISGTGA
jgi:hypothetical protein